MPNDITCTRVYKVINKPVTYWGVERRLFLAALFIAAATFNFFASLSCALLIWVCLYLFGRWATVTDPQILRILLNSSKFKRRYDPAKPAELIFGRTRRA